MTVAQDEPVVVAPLAPGTGSDRPTRVGRWLPAAYLAVPMAVLVVLLCVYGVASAALGTGPTAALGDAAKGAGSQPIAVFSMVGDTGAILGPLAAGLLADHFGMGAAFASGAAILLAGAVLSWRIPARLDRRTPQEA